MLATDLDGVFIHELSEGRASYGLLQGVWMAKIMTEALLIYMGLASLY